MYESPINVRLYEQYKRDMKEMITGNVMKHLVHIGVEVNEDELKKALDYDRKQYFKGYKDGYADAEGKITEAIDQLKKVLEEL